jgi:hypothetical protein
MQNATDNPRVAPNITPMKPIGRKVAGKLPAITEHLNDHPRLTTPETASKMP